MAHFCFLTIAGREIGFGHLSRCLNLASAVQAEGHQVSFAVFGLSEDEAGDVLQGRQAVYRDIIDLFDACLKLTSCGEEELDCIIVDAAHTVVLRDHSACSTLFETVRSKTATVALIDGVADQSLLQQCPHISLDVVIYPYVGIRAPAAATCKAMAGAEYAILAPEYANFRNREIRECANRVLISCGGSDPTELTRVVAQALLKARTDLEVMIVIGPLFRSEYEDSLRSMVPPPFKGFQFVRHPASLAELMVWTDVAVVTSGLIKYELAATGTPTITLSIDSYHDKVNRIFSSGGSITDLGLDHSRSAITRSVEHLLGDVEGRRRMSAAGKQLVDGKGAARIAQELSALVETPRPS